MKNTPNLKVVHRQQNSTSGSPEEIYQQLSEVRENLQDILSLLDQHFDLNSLKNRRGDTGKTSIASYC